MAAEAVSMLTTPHSQIVALRIRSSLLVLLHCTATLAVLLAPASTSRAAELDIARLFAAPDLSGESLRLPRISPDGRLVAYLKGAADNRDRLDLWAYDLTRRAHRRLIDARALAPDSGALSAEEAARRERQRTSAYSGILEYGFSPDARRILVPLGGDLYLYDLTSPEASAVRRLTHTDSYETDARFSPRGRYVSFIRDRNLVVLDLTTGTETTITHGATDTVSFGMAEFIAQEEMDRDTGYWWSPDESRIAYTRVDESGVAETERFEIDARSVTVVRQRYPHTGARNAAVSLHVTTLANPAGAVQVDLGTNPDFYLARVDFFPDGRQLAVQKQSRNQQTLELLQVDAATGNARPLLTERSDTWVPITDELTFLPERRQFIWASSRDGYQQLYLYDFSGRLIRQLTNGAYSVVGDRQRAAVRGVDEERGLIYVMSPADNPRERQLYAIALDRKTAPRQITQGAGWHSITMADNARVFLDAFSNTDTPPTLRLHDSSGKLLNELVPNKLAPGHPYFEYAAAHAHTEFGTFNAADGQTLHYSLLKPLQMEPGRRYPVVVHVYGGPGVQEVVNRWGGSWQMFQQLLVKRGYIVFTVDNRGSGARGVRFESALFHRLGSVEVEDQLAGVQFLRSLPYVDGAHIGIMGWSYGGYMSALSVMKGPDAFASAVAGAPVTDWHLYDTHYTERYLGTPAQNAAGYASGDVLAYAASLKRPLLLIHGMADDNVLFTNSTALMRALQNADRPFELMTYPGGKHGLIRHQDDGPHVMQQIMTFLDRTLKP
jgi:dipeptidyl-peptidase 4